MTRTTASSALLLPDPAHSFWARIAHELADAIGSGLYAPGERLPSEHSLAEQFGVNRHTIRRSLASLGQIGLVRSTQGSGTYVEDFAVDLVLGRRTRHRQSLAQAGLPGGMQVLSSRTVRATADVAKALEIRLATQCCTCRWSATVAGNLCTSATASFRARVSPDWTIWCGRAAPSRRPLPNGAWPTTHAARAASRRGCPIPMWPHT